MGYGGLLAIALFCMIQTRFQCPHYLTLPITKSKPNSNTIHFLCPRWLFSFGWQNSHSPSSLRSIAAIHQQKNLHEWNLQSKCPTAPQDREGIYDDSNYNGEGNMWMWIWTTMMMRTGIMKITKAGPAKHETFSYTLCNAAETNLLTLLAFFATLKTMAFRRLLVMRMKQTKTHPLKIG